MYNYVMTAPLSRKFSLVLIVSFSTFCLLVGLGAVMNYYQKAPEREMKQQAEKNFLVWMNYQANGQAKEFCSHLSPKDIADIKKETGENSCEKLYSNKPQGMSQSEAIELSRLRKASYKTLHIDKITPQKKGFLINYSVLREDLVQDQSKGKKVDQNQRTTFQVLAFEAQKNKWIFEDKTPEVHLDLQ